MLPLNVSCAGYMAGVPVWKEGGLIPWGLCVANGPFHLECYYWGHVANASTNARQLLVSLSLFAYLSWNLYTVTKWLQRSGFRDWRRGCLPSSCDLLWSRGHRVLIGSNTPLVAVRLILTPGLVSRLQFNHAPWSISWQECNEFSQYRKIVSGTGTFI